MIGEQELRQALARIRQKTDAKPRLGLVLGSGLGEYGDHLPNAIAVPYGEIPHMPVSTVAGHKGQFLINEDVVCMQGRFHYYEGYDMNEVVMGVRLMRLMGVKTLVLTNAAGGVEPTFAEGTLMLLTDHINFMGQNPLRGPNLDFLGPRFPDMSHCYSLRLRHMAKQTASTLGILLAEGVYCAFSGPSYETPEEVRMARKMGAQAVGMSTVPECIAAVHCGMEVLGISCITNAAAGVKDQSLSHQNIIAVTQRVKGDFTRLIDGICQKILAQP